MGGAVLVVNLILATVALAAAFLLRPKSPKAAKDDTPPNLSTRGTKLNHVLGTRRTGAVIAWVGDRFTRREKSSGGGKGGGGGGSRQTIYFESAWHQICVGPASGLKAVFSAGKIIWQGDLTPGTAPSGTTVDLGKEGSFRIYWGDATQPIDPLLSDRIGIQSRWANCCFIVWVNRRLGPSAVWQQHEYVVSVLPNDTTPSYEPLVQSSEQIFYLDAEGINPAHALWRLLAAPFPHGIGISTGLLDRESFEQFGILCVSDNLASNILIEDEIDEGVSSILVDCSCVLFEKADKLHVRGIRFSTDGAPVFSEDNFSKPDIEVFLDIGEGQSNRIVYVLKNEEDFKYRDWDIKIDDDSQFSEKTTRTNIEIATNPQIANIIANRRNQERGVISGVSLLGIKQARNIFPGDSFELPNVGLLRCITRQPEWDSNEVKIDCVLDNFAFPGTGDEQIDVFFQESRLAVQPDIAFNFLTFDDEREFNTGPALRSISVFRLRAHNQILGADIYASFSNGNYTILNNQVSASGGFLVNAITDTDDTNIRIKDVNGDMDQVLDLSSDVDSWTNGRQWAVINDEIAYLDAVQQVPETLWAASTAYSVGDYVAPLTANGFRFRCTVAGSSGPSEPSFSAARLEGDAITDGTVVWVAEFFEYDLLNLIRGENGSADDDHDAGDYVFIIDSSQVTEIRDPMIRNGWQLFVISAPFTNEENIDIGLVTPVNKVL